MAPAIKSLRRSISVFLDSYHSFASIATFLVFPFSASLLLSQSLSPSPFLLTLYLRISSLFLAAGFPPSSPFFSLLNSKLSQAIFSFLSTLPFTLTFFLAAKAAIILTITKPSPISSLLRLYRFLLSTHLYNTFAVLSANAAFFSIVFLAFNFADALRLHSGPVLLALSAAGAILYSIIIANATVVCNLAEVVAVSENSSGGCFPLLKACVMIRGREAAAITLALPANLGMAAVEALFQHRVVNPWRRSSRSLTPSAMGEAFCIAYTHSLLVVLDVIISCMLYRSCREEEEEAGDEEKVMQV
ncbi:hypothetical protein AXF42_Ash012872 [Apostasia shenzhenica]|uniref:Uncharacterized protein n=1 Tax=Apostasia shenzhenica TaxID=1088818 RepID=A0A2I0ARG3_9ASPA|nr:hypothetical protein AXF42_Ash012872 [Apostasia shenzhenica]